MAHGFDLVTVARDLEIDRLRFLGDQHLDQAVVEHEDVARGVAKALQLDSVPFAVDVDAWALGRLFELGLDLSVAQP
ncbi:MAG TPA: hypothetical protein VFY10_04055 [Dehalococcoidia bacterium]|nr:hypothetical protein [Dehalococcoidia bacterium]